MNESLLGSSIHGILQARILEWVAMPSSRGSSQPRKGTCLCYIISCLGKWVFYSSVQFSRSVVPHSLQTYEPQLTRPPFSIPASCPFSLLSDRGWHLWTPDPAHVSVHLPVWVSSNFNLFMPYSPLITVRVTAMSVLRGDCDGPRKCGLCSWWISSRRSTMICTCSLWLLFLDHSEVGLKGLAEDAQETNKDN